jgi:hypothetical protein
MSQQAEIGSKIESKIGSEYPTTGAPEPKLKSVALVQLIAIVTLALSTLIAATAVSIGLAHAQFGPAMTVTDAAPLALSRPPMDGAA